MAPTAGRISHGSGEIVLASIVEVGKRADRGTIQPGCVKIGSIGSPKTRGLEVDLPITSYGYQYQ
jgi:hypothetical protein